ncbi:MAG: type II toxin-antitoxin system death-on-curing family toxin [Paenibacillaceae bacterium]
MKIALFDSIAKNHVFQNANKRTAFASLIQFLEYNGHEFVMPEKDAEDFTVDVVNHKFEFFEMVEIIKSNTNKKHFLQSDTLGFGVFHNQISDADLN